MGGDDREAAGGGVGAEGGEEAGDGLGVERDGGLVEEPEAAGGDEQAGEAEAALLAGGAEVRRAVGERPEAEGGERRGGVAAEEAGPEGEVLGDGELRLDGVEVAGVGDAPRRGRRGRAARPSIATRPEAGRRPASARSSVDLPAPFGPRRTSVSPGASAKDRPSRMRRPPRVQERSVTVRPMRVTA